MHTESTINHAPSQSRYSQLQYRFAVISDAPSIIYSFSWGWRDATEAAHRVHQHPAAGAGEGVPLQQIPLQV